MSVPRSHRRAWLAVGSVFAVATLAWGTLQVVVAWAYDSETTVQTIPQPIRTIDVGGGGTGRVRIIGADVDHVTVTAKIRRGLKATEQSTTVDGDRLVLRSDCPVFLSNYCDVAYTIETPHDVDVVVRAEDGRVTVSDVSGAVDAACDQGRVEAIRVAGPTKLRSDQGRVHLEFATAPTNVKAHSDQGSVRIVVPPGAETYRVDASTDQGSTDVAVPTNSTSDRVIVASSDQGDVSVRFPTA
jgi:hypothetical protein